MQNSCNYITGHPSLLFSPYLWSGAQLLKCTAPHESPREAYHPDRKWSHHETFCAVKDSKLRASSSSWLTSSYGNTDASILSLEAPLARSARGTLPKLCIAPVGFRFSPIIRGLACG